MALLSQMLHIYIYIKRRLIYVYVWSSTAFGNEESRKNMNLAGNVQCSDLPLPSLFLFESPISAQKPCLKMAHLFHPLLSHFPALPLSLVVRCLR